MLSVFYLYRISRANSFQWSAENSADDIKKGGKDVHTNNPAEELDFHVLLNDTTNSLLGANYGYPACFSTWDASALGKIVGRCGHHVQYSSNNAACAGCVG